MATKAASAHGNGSCERPPFEPALNWNERTWLRYERIVHTIVCWPKTLGLLAAALVLPTLMLLLPLVPLILWLSLGRPPPARGPHQVGWVDVFPTVACTSGPKQLRLRLFYPACLDDSPPPPASPWLPEPASSYAPAHATFLGIPARIAQWLTLPLRLARTAPGLHERVPAASASDGSDWPLTFFSHGLGGTVATYSVLCAEIASHGSVVVAMEHKDGSAIAAHTPDGEHVPFAHRSADELKGTGEQEWRAEQVRTRLDEFGAVLSCLSRLFQATPLADVRVETSAVALVGHSFGGATMLSAAGSASCMPRGMSIRALVALDPWMLPVLHAGDLHVPTMVLTTPNLMFPSNALALTATMRTLRGRANCMAIFAEAKLMRHQEMSDMAAITRISLRATMMAGTLHPDEALRRTTDPTIGFLAMHGALRRNGSLSLTRAVATVRAMLGRAPRSDSDAADYIVHGAFDPAVSAAA